MTEARVQKSAKVSRAVRTHQRSSRKRKPTKAVYFLQQTKGFEDLKNINSTLMKFIAEFADFRRKTYEILNAKSAVVLEPVGDEELEELLAGDLIAGPEEHAAQNDLTRRAKTKVAKLIMLSSSQVSPLLGSVAKSNDRQYANKLRLAGEILGLPSKKNQYLYPIFQFDTRRSQVRPTVAEVNKILDARNDPWGVASWWITPLERLAGRSPKELLGTEEENRILELARSELDLVG